MRDTGVWGCGKKREGNRYRRVVLSVLSDTSTLCTHVGRGGVKEWWSDTRAITTLFYS